MKKKSYVLEYQRWGDGSVSHSFNIFEANELAKQNLDYFSSGIALFDMKRRMSFKKFLGLYDSLAEALAMVIKLVKYELRDSERDEKDVEVCFSETPLLFAEVSELIHLATQADEIVGAHFSYDHEHYPNQYSLYLHFGTIGTPWHSEFLKTGEVKIRTILKMT